MTLGQRIIVLRRKKGWTQRRLALEMKSDIHSVCCWEKGKTEPSLYSFFRLCRTLGISFDEFMKGVEL